MTEERITLQLLWKSFTGDELKIFFGNDASEKVLILSGLVAFVEKPFSDVDRYILQVRTGGSVYGMDMSLQLNTSAYAHYNEVFLFVNEQGPNIALRALAEDVVWRDIDQLAH